MKLWLISALMLALVAGTAPTTAQAKRLGGGNSAGMQRSMPERTAPTAPPPKPAAPTQATPNNAAATPAAAPPAAPKRNWMGPLAGLAAGLGIAALMSHFGMGEAFGNALMFALLAGGAVLLVMFLLRRFGPNATRGPVLAGAAAGGGQPAWPQPLPTPSPVERVALPVTAAPVGALPAAAAGAEAATITRAFVPATFDAEGFTRTAKLIFIRLQTAHDTADLDDLRRFTTPELFASIRLDIQERGATPQQTDVVKVDAEVLDVAEEADRQIVSVRFHGQVIEEKGAAATAFNEVWHLVKPHDDSRSWAIAGIEQLK